MKSVILIISFLLVSIFASAQTQIPNSNFENWEIATNGTDSLAGWSSSNSIVISPVISLYSDVDYNDDTVDYVLNVRMNQIVMIAKIQLNQIQPLMRMNYLSMKPKKK